MVDHQILAGPYGFGFFQSVYIALIPAFANQVFNQVLHPNPRARSFGIR